MRRTTRLDVGLALSFAGLAYLVWALVAGVSRAVVQEMIQSTALTQTPLPPVTLFVKRLFVDYGFGIDSAGLVWLALSLYLVFFASRQKFGISWVWVSAILQSFVAALGAVLVSWATAQPRITQIVFPSRGDSLVEKVSSISLPVMLVAAILIWVDFLVALLVERAYFNRRGPSLRDGLRTNR